MVITPIAKQKRDLTVLKKIFSQKYIFILVTKMKNDLLQFIKCTGSLKTGENLQDGNQKFKKHYK